jgi:hypothetical protein
MKSMHILLICLLSFLVQFYYCNNDPIEENELGTTSDICIAYYCPSITNLDVWLSIEYYCHGKYNDEQEIKFRNYISQSESQSSLSSSSSSSSSDIWSIKILLGCIYGVTAMIGLTCGMWWGRGVHTYQKLSLGYKLISSAEDSDDSTSPTTPSGSSYRHINHTRSNKFDILNNNNSNNNSHHNTNDNCTSKQSNNYITFNGSLLPSNNNNNNNNSQTKSLYNSFFSNYRDHSSSTRTPPEDRYDHLPDIRYEYNNDNDNNHTAISYNHYNNNNNNSHNNNHNSNNSTSNEISSIDGRERVAASNTSLLSHKKIF